MPHNARPGATAAWNDVVCTIRRAFRLTTANADSAHKTDDAMLKDMTILCKIEWSSPPAASASRETRSTCPVQIKGFGRVAPKKVTFLDCNRHVSIMQYSRFIERVGCSEYERLSHEKSWYAWSLSR